MDSKVKSLIPVGPLLFFENFVYHTYVVPLILKKNLTASKKT
jgi:hypothetical protein